jgi:hypothetical protein
MSFSEIDQKDFQFSHTFILKTSSLQEIVSIILCLHSISSSLCDSSFFLLDSKTFSSSGLNLLASHLGSKKFQAYQSFTSLISQAFQTFTTFFKNNTFIEKG